MAAVSGYFDLSDNISMGSDAIQMAFLIITFPIQIIPVTYMIGLIPSILTGFSYWLTFKGHSKISLRKHCLAGVIGSIISISSYIFLFAPNDVGFSFDQFLMTIAVMPGFFSAFFCSIVCKYEMKV